MNAARVPRATVAFFGLGGVALGIVGNAVTYFLLITRAIWPMWPEGTETVAVDDV